MKKILIILVILTTGCVGEAAKNFEDLEHVEIGMSFSRVQGIMSNKPIKVEVSSDDYFIEVYSSHFAASDDYRIFYSKLDSTVVDIGYGN